MSQRRNREVRIYSCYFKTMFRRRKQKKNPLLKCERGGTCKHYEKKMNIKMQHPSNVNVNFKLLVHNVIKMNNETREKRMINNKLLLLKTVT